MAALGRCVAGLSLSSRLTWLTSLRLSHSLCQTFSTSSSPDQTSPDQTVSSALVLARSRAPGSPSSSGFSSQTSCNASRSVGRWCLWRGGGVVSSSSLSSSLFRQLKSVSRFPQITTVEIYDPAFNALDHAFLQAENLIVLQTNTVR